ncbi:structural maintenance of chromosomes protein 2-2 [Trichonephila clavipes]|nr:structural maintenance of chromosomes protein 2-2 [Trichonephila clavipes]
MTLADCHPPLFTCRMIYRSSPAVVVLGRPPPTFLTAVPVVCNAFQARKTTLLLILNYAATLVTVRPSSSFPIILPRVKSSRQVPSKPIRKSGSAKQYENEGRRESISEFIDSKSQDILRQIPRWFRSGLEIVGSILVGGCRLSGREICRQACHSVMWHSKNLFEY